MKKLIFLSLFVNMILTGYSQTFYVEKTEQGYESPIVDKLLDLNYKVIDKADGADSKIQVLFSKARAGKAECYILIYDSKTGLLQKKSETVSAAYSALAGYESVKLRLAKKLAKSVLAETLLQIKK